jgi:hypothetical protein
VNWATYGVIILFGAFIILMVLNPNLSCFGRKITSPLYPILRKKKKSQKRIKTQDYGFRLSDDREPSLHRSQKSGEEEEFFLEQFKEKKYKTKDYGFKLSDADEAQNEGVKEGNGEDSL